MKLNAGRLATTLTPHVFLTATALLLGAGCLDEAPLDDESLGTTAQDVTVSKQDLDEMGYKCLDTGNGTSYCFVCREVGDNDYCYAYHCDAAGVCNGGPSNTEAQVSIWFEAEAARRWEPMVVGGSVNASGGGYVTVPASAGAASNFRFSLSIERDGDLYAWARVQVPTAVGPNDTWINMDNAGGWSVQLPTTGSAWQWVPLADATTGEHRGMPTTAGDHQFRLYSNATGVRIDRVLLSHSPARVPYSEMFEAEAMNVYGSMTKVVPTATTWANPGYVWAPNGAAGDGNAQATIYVPQADLYSIWGRVKAPTTADNSFSISTDFSPLVTWTMPVTGTAWAWNHVTAIGTASPRLFALSANFPTIEFMRREDGTKLDRYLVTNDPGFVPADAPLVNATP